MKKINNINNIPPLPKFPPSQVIREGTIGDCPICGSTTDKKYIWFGEKIGCINERCSNYKYYKSKKQIRKEKLKKLNGKR